MHVVLQVVVREREVSLVNLSELKREEEKKEKGRKECLREEGA